MRSRSRWASSSLSWLLQLGQPLPQLGLDRGDRPPHGLVAGDVVGGGEDDQLVEVLAQVSPVSASKWRIRSTCVAEELDAHGLLLVRGVQLDGVAPDPELAPGEDGVVAVVVQVDQLPQQVALVDGVTGPQRP